MTTDINFNITGIENLIEDLKATRCHCSNVACNNNCAWEGRNILLPPKCLLPSVYLGKEGECKDNLVKKPHGETSKALMTKYQKHWAAQEANVEASAKARDLLDRVSIFATNYLKAEGRCQIPESLLDEINDHLGKEE